MKYNIIILQCTITDIAI